MMSKKFISILGIAALAVALIVTGIALTGSDSAPAGTDAVSGDATLTLLGPVSGTVEVGALQRVSWMSQNYGAATVAVNIIRKVSENPARYELVRTVSAATQNDGEAVWVPAKTDVGSGIFIEIGCALSSQGCRATAPTLALAVVDTGRNANTAAAYQAIEQMNNK